MLNNAKVDGYELKLTNRVMKKYLFIALALLGMASCAKDDLGNGNKPHHNGEVEESYIAINLMSADSGTRGTSGTTADDYEEGTDAERAVKTAYFFFFDEDGEPFTVNTTNTPATAPGTEKNHLALSISNTSTSGMPNVSDIKEAVLVLSTYKGEYPSKIVAIVNWTPTEDKSYALDELHDVLANSLGNDTTGYVMSNSVYMDLTGAMIDATPLTADNIKSTDTEAIANPINIYVERTAAKIVLTANGGTVVTEGTNINGNSGAGSIIFNVTKDSGEFEPIGGTAKNVYMQLLGWELYDEVIATNILKNIDTTWDDTALGLTWNDRANYRCYWALSSGTKNIDETFAWGYTGDWNAMGFASEYGYAVAPANDEYATRKSYTYCGENTKQSTPVSTEGLTKVILKGRLLEKTDDTNYKTLEIARWYGNEYSGNGDLRIAVANSLKYTLFSSSDGTNFDSIKPEDLMCVAGSVVGAEAYEVGFQLSSADGYGTNKTWYKYDSVNGYVRLGDSGIVGDNVAKANEHLKTIEPALLYASGQTYYIVDIEHFGNAKEKPAYYGIVRNHVYQIDINSIKGYGSPIFDGYSDVVTPPDYPEEDESSYVAAKINVLSWKIVQQTVDIVQ